MSEFNISAINMACDMLKMGEIFFQDYKESCHRSITPPGTNCRGIHPSEQEDVTHLILAYALVDGIALGEIVLQNLTRPDAEGCTSFALDTITDGNYHIQAIIGHRLFDTINTQKNAYCYLAVLLLLKTHC